MGQHSKLAPTNPERLLPAAKRLPSKSGEGENAAILQSHLKMLRDRAGPDLMQLAKAHELQINNIYIYIHTHS